MPPDLTWYKLLTDLGSLIGGAFALLAGVAAYIAGRVQASATRQAAKMQVQAERQKGAREVEALRRSLATEIRQIVPSAFTAYKLLIGLANKKGSPITLPEFENLSLVSVPVVFPAAADKIGFLDEAMDILIIYNLIEIGRAGAERLIRGQMPTNVSPRSVAAVANAFLAASSYAREVLPKLKTGVSSHDDKDAQLIQQISEAVDRDEARRAVVGGV
jgi:hypothetical protein